MGKDSWAQRCCRGSLKWWKSSAPSKRNPNTNDIYFSKYQQSRTGFRGGLRFRFCRHLTRQYRSIRDSISTTRLSILRQHSLRSWNRISENLMLLKSSTISVLGYTKRCESLPAANPGPGRHSPNHSMNLNVHTFASLREVFKLQENSYPMKMRCWNKFQVPGLQFFPLVACRCAVRNATTLVFRLCSRSRT